ncbi:hypothetical protein Tco_0581376 [Tanacetum coccineum]
MNPRCSALLQNHLPPKEQDPRSFILPCSIGKLDFNNALADLGASISVMPLSMYKRLVDFVILVMVEDLRMPIILGRPLLATAHAKVDIFRKFISLEVGSEKFNWLLGINPDIFSYEIDIHESYEEIVYKITEVVKEKYSAPQEKKVHWCKAILQEKENERYGKVCIMTGERILKDYWKERLRDEEDDLEENLEDREECKEDKANAIIRAIHDKLNNDLFNNISEDEDDLEGILYYLNQDHMTDSSIRMKKPITRESEVYSKVKVLGVEEIPRSRDNVATMRVRLMEKMAHKGNDQAKM